MGAKENVAMIGDNVDRASHVDFAAFFVLKLYRYEFAAFIVLFRFEYSPDISIPRVLKSPLDTAVAKKITFDPFPSQMRRVPFGVSQTPAIMSIDSLGT